MVNVDKTQSSKLNYLFKLGCSQYAAGDFIDALKTLEQAKEQLLKKKQYIDYLQCQNLLVLMHIEMENFSKIDTIRQELSAIVTGSEMGIYYARFHYALGFCFLRQNKYDRAQEQFERALAQTLKLKATATENKCTEDLLISNIDICYISYGFANLHTLKNDIPEALHELKNMGTLMENLEQFSPKINTTERSNRIKDLLEHLKNEQESLGFVYNFLQAYILKIEQKYNSAEELFWLCYEHCHRNSRRKYMTLHLLYFLGKNYMEKKDYEQALIFLNLAKKSVNPKIFKKMDRCIVQALTKLREAMKNNYDIVVNFEDKVIVEKDKGPINAKNQFILLDMLKLFISNAGSVFSKEDLVEKIWKQTYDPVVHDNKIYVTIKRLRELVEPDYQNPKYIFRAKGGYYINKKVRVLLK